MLSVRALRSLARPSFSLTRALSSAASDKQLLVVNTGSSTLKYKMFKVEPTGVGAAIFSGLVDLSTPTSANGHITHKDLVKGTKTEVELPLENHSVAFDTAVAKFFGPNVDNIQAVGHRVVHGGEAFAESVKIDENVVKAIEDNIKLAPLHNPANLLGIECTRKTFGQDTPMVAVFDTAYHMTMPPKAYTYAVPHELYEQHGVRRYGFHGTSHQFVMKQAASILGKSPAQTSVVTCHLGNGSSMAAIRNGKVVDTTMGLTPLEGLCMGTRSGDVDPALHNFLATQLDMSISDIDKMLNKKSGLLGICGDSDVRAIQNRVRKGDDPLADLALDVFAHRVRKYLGAYLLELGGAADAIVFAGGVGESSAMIRERVCKDLEFLGIKLDQEKNAVSMMGSGPIEISTPDSKLKVLVINTDEELSIAEQTYDIVLRNK